MNYISTLFNRGLCITIVGLTVLLSACSVPTLPNYSNRSWDTTTEDSSTRTLTRTQWLAQAKQFLKQARRSASPETENLQLRAVDSLIKAGDLNQAAQVLGYLNTIGLTPGYRSRLLLHRAQIVLARNQPARALALLGEIPGAQRSPLLEQLVQSARAKAFMALNKPLSAARALIARERFLATDQQIWANQQRILQSLEELNPEQITTVINTNHDPVLLGWLSLARLSLKYGRGSAQWQRQLSTWRRSYPRHPSRLDSTRAPLVSHTQFIKPVHIALLLPLSSRHSAAARAIHDGFTAMHQSEYSNQPRISIIDSGEEVSLIANYYRLAVKQGADFVIGPLGKEAAQQLIQTTHLSQPTLLLGSIENQRPPPNAMIFALNPEHEARQVAKRAYLEGFRNVAVLFPESSWGERSALAFSDYWTRLGGHITQQRSYLETINDFSSSIKQLLGVDLSEERKRQLAATLGTQLEFQPRRRQDIDFVFLVAKAKTARLVKPQLNFYAGHDLPVFSTSMVYAGRPDHINDIDLDQISFGDMPWLLSDHGHIKATRDSLPQGQKYRHTPLDRLYALGIDAYRVATNVAELSQRTTVINGASGVLSLDSGNRINRELNWAKFENGLPTLKGRLLGQPSEGKNEYMGQFKRRLRSYNSRNMGRE